MLGVYSSIAVDVRACIHGTYEDDHIILPLLLSFLEWKKHNGEIKIYLDDKLMHMFENNKLLSFVDTVDYTTLKKQMKSIDSELFWAANKIFAIQNETIEELCSIDTDLIVWDCLDDHFGNEIFALHSESCYMNNYLQKNEAEQIFNYDFSTMDFTRKPINTCFLFFKKRYTREKYCNEAIEIMKSYRGNWNIHTNHWSPILFVEQHLLGIRNDVVCFFKKEKPRNNTYPFTHIWQLKKQIYKIPSLYEWFNLSIVTKILKNHDSRIEELIKIPQFYRWYKKWLVSAPMVNCRNSPVRT